MLYLKSSRAIDTVPNTQTGGDIYSLHQALLASLVQGDARDAKGDE